MLRLQFQVDGINQVNRALVVASEAVKDLRPVWESVYDDFLKRERVVFAREGNYGSPTREMNTPGPWGDWAPLNYAYAEQKKAKGFGSRILVRTGRLRDSLTQRGHADAVFVPGRMTMAMGTKVPYSGYHQHGTRRKNGLVLMPRREPVRISEVQARFWVRLIQKFLVSSGQFQREIL